LIMVLIFTFMFILIKALVQVEWYHLGNDLAVNHSDLVALYRQ
jgi:hypothetical protein